MLVSWSVTLTNLVPLSTEPFFADDSDRDLDWEMASSITDNTVGGKWQKVAAWLLVPSVTFGNGPLMNLLPCSWWAGCNFSVHAALTPEVPYKISF